MPYITSSISPNQSQYFQSETSAFQHLNHHNKFTTAKMHLPTLLVALATFGSAIVMAAPLTEVELEIHPETSNTTDTLDTRAVDPIFSMAYASCAMAILPPGGGLPPTVRTREDMFFNQGHGEQGCIQHRDTSLSTWPGNNAQSFTTHVCGHKVDFKRTSQGFDVWSAGTTAPRIAWCTPVQGKSHYCWDVFGSCTVESKYRCWYTGIGKRLCH
ncbi:hypothetical protein QBC38DRAFT_521006 [Podospora fimiseda]|uniref:Uncharacterized protein n=1 Tax=Podospora fimiseda TaxID=252190 RepID=A0AAN6YS38_9PEZI|nr:hypothetical protein QBC38DRAFT_521006 [Podospora fimiseda]